ncbi:TPA: VOC family protein [bacterium]|nr:VOC family protein [bacterium]
MNLGAFSVSLNVKNINASVSFYEKLGFKVFYGNVDENWVIMKNGDCVIGLFQGMFEDNILTFNPGWDNNAKEVNPFIDVRELQKELKKQGIEFKTEVDENGEGPGYFVIQDPDGNTILFDQHR